MVVLIEYMDRTSETITCDDVILEDDMFKFFLSENNLTQSSLFLILPSVNIKRYEIAKNVN